MAAYSSNLVSAVGKTKDSEKEGDFSSRLNYFAKKFVELCESKFKDYHCEVIGDTSKAGDTASMLKECTGVFNIIPKFGKIISKPLEAGAGFTGEKLHAIKAARVIGKLEDFEKKSILKVLVHSGVNIFFALESQLMSINHKKVTGGWKATFDIIIDQLIARATDDISSKEEFNFCDKNLSECALNFDNKRIKNVGHKAKDILLRAKFTPEIFLRNVGFLTTDNLGVTTYFCKEEKYIENYGFRRLFLGEEKSPKGYCKTDKCPPSYNYLMLEDSVNEWKDKLLAEIVEASKPDSERIEEIGEKIEEKIDNRADKTDGKIGEIADGIDVIGDGMSEIKQQLKGISMAIKPRVNLEIDQDQLQRDDPKFEKFTNLPEDLSKFLNLNKEKSFKMCVISSLDCKVTAERIMDAGGITVVNWKTGQGFKENLHTYAFTNVENIQELVEFGDSKQLIMIVITDKESEKALKQTDDNHVAAYVEDNLSWKNLAPNYKKELLERNVLIQGHTLSLSEWMNATNTPQDKPELDGQLLLDLINDKIPVLLKDTLPEKLKLQYYVRRTLRSKTTLCRAKIFQDRSNDVFAFSGLGKYELSTLVNDEHEALCEKKSKLDTTPPGTDFSKNQIKQTSLSVRFILLKPVLDFKDICRMTSEPVHWVQRETNGIYRLVKSRGSMKVIQGMVEDENKQNEYLEKEFLDEISSDKDLGDLSEQPECISDSPGMGKSIFLAAVRSQILEKNPTTVGIFQELPKFIISIKKEFPKEESRCADTYIQHLFSSIITCDFSKNCLESGYKSKALNVNLFLDAYDEVDSEDADLCKTILNELKKAGNIRVFITSRPHLLPELENICEVLGWNILPFTEQDQYNFLLSYWKNNRPEGNEYQKMEIDPSKLEKYTKNFVYALQNQWNDKERAIAGIPLQCHLIAENFHADAFKSSSNDSHDSFSNSREPSPEIGSLTKLYTGLVEKQIEIFKERYPKKSADYPKVNNWYAAKAFEDLFPGVNYKVLLGEDDADLEKMINVGIVERKRAEGKTEFIHRTFADYFIAQALFQLLANPEGNNCSQESQDFKSSLVTFFKILFTLGKDEVAGFKLFQWLDILYHLNALLEDTRTITVITLNLKFSEEDLTKLSYSIVYDDLPNILKLLQDWNCFEGIENNIFNQELIEAAVQYSSLKLLEMVIKYKTKEEMSEMVDKTTTVTLLHIAVARGDYKIFEFILRTYYTDKVRNCQDSEDDVLSYLVHTCVSPSLNDSDVIINDKKDIIERLLKLNEGLLEFSFGNRTPILEKFIHPQLLHFLIERANVFATTKDYNETLLDIATSYMPYKEYSHLEQILYKAGYFKELIRNSSSIIIEKIFSIYTLSKDTFNIFKEVGVDFKEMSKFVFKHASRLTLTNQESVEYLKTFYDVWIESNITGQSCLHIAVETLNPTIVAWLIDSKGLNVNCLDTLNGDDTPLHYCSRIKCHSRNTKQVTKIVKLLLNRRGDPGILNSDRESALHLAARYSCKEIVKMFVNIVEDINGKDCNGNTALLRAAKNKQPNSILSVLLEHGGNPKVENNRGENLLHLVSCNKKWVERLVEEGLSVDSTDKEGNTPFHFAALESDCIEVIYKLVDMGGNINAVNEGGFTPFDVYLYQASLRRLEVVKYFIARIPIPNMDRMTAALKTLISRQFNHPILEETRMPPKKSNVNNNYSIGSKDTKMTVRIASELLSNGADVEGLISNISQIFEGLENYKSDFQYELLKLLHDNNVCSPKVIAYQGLVLMVKCHEISEDYLELGKTFADCLDDINIADSEGRTLLHLAWEARSLEGEKFLKEKGKRKKEAVFEILHGGMEGGDQQNAHGQEG